jgi:peptide/nickel transport system permease protein
MSRLVLRRVAVVPFVAFGVATLVFLVLRIVPGSAVDSLAGQAATGEQRRQITAALGLDQSLLVQYGKFLKGAVTLNPGQSFYSGQDVSSLLGDVLPATIELAVASALLMVVFGVGTGALAARYRGTWIDTTLRFVAILFFSMPWFVLGVVLILLVGVQLGLLPTFGRLPPGTDYQPTTGFVLIDAIVQGRPDLIWPWLEHLILPAITVGLTTAGFITRTSRAAILEVLGEDFVRSARMKGMTEGRVFWRHVLRNAALPVVTVVGVQFGALLGGAVVTEVVYAYPGVGRLLVNAIAQRDFPVVQGASLAVAFLYILVNALTDLSYLVLDPRLRRA